MGLPKVNIIVSTYNGEKYINEQLDSLLLQEYPNISIYVRDDGSTDATQEILKVYEAEQKIHLFQGENIGFCRSFFELLSHVDTGDYWAFCDQDDIWKPEKVRRAVEYLEQHPQKDSLPLLYYSYSEMIDEYGKSLGIQQPPKGSLCFRRSLTGTFGVGFSMVINRTLRMQMLKCCPARVHSHDWLAGAIALGVGEVIVDQTICAYYRRLDSSVTRISGIRRVKWFVNSFLHDSDVKERNIEYSRCFLEELNEEKRTLMRLFDGQRYSLQNSLKKAVYPERWRPSIGSEVAMRFLMLIGRI